MTGLFFAEENWRGQKAWENCKRDLKTQGRKVNWADYIPAPVPDEENVFGVLEMQRWFKGGNAAAWTDLTRKLPAPSFPGVEVDRHTKRMLVAEVRIGLPGKPIPADFVVLRWDDPAWPAEAARLITNALGSTARTPQSRIGVGLMLRRPEDLQAAQIFLLCETAPTLKMLQAFLPDTIVNANAGLPESVLKFEPDGRDAYRVTMPVLGRVADYLAWSDGLEPQFAVIRQALQRPHSRMQGFYGNPNTVPGPNFRPVRNLIQTLGARAECHLLLGQPEAALNDVTLIHDFCRIFDENEPTTLLKAMVNVAVRGLYAAQIAEGLRLQAWREPQLAVLEAQLNHINVVLPVAQAFELEAVAAFHTLESVPSAGFVKKSVWSGLCPRGWGYQRIVKRVNLDFGRIASLAAANQVIFTGQVEAADRKSQALDHWSPYAFAAHLTPVDFTRACQNTAHAQTEINQALLACALERYHLAHGEYPPILDALIPQFLIRIPHDVIGGRAPIYSRATGGTYMLYSIGWKGIDHGGVRGKSSPNLDGDWVWPD